MSRHIRVKPAGLEMNADLIEQSYRDTQKIGGNDQRAEMHRKSTDVSQDHKSVAVNAMTYESIQSNDDRLDQLFDQYKTKEN